MHKQIAGNVKLSLEQRDLVSVSSRLKHPKVSAELTLLEIGLFAGSSLLMFTVVEAGIRESIFCSCHVPPYLVVGV